MNSEEKTLNPGESAVTNFPSAFPKKKSFSFTLIIALIVILALGTAVWYFTRGEFSELSLIHKESFMVMRVDFAELARKADINSLKKEKFWQQIEMMLAMTNANSILNNHEKTGLALKRPVHIVYRTTSGSLEAANAINIILSVSDAEKLKEFISSLSMPSSIPIEQENEIYYILQDNICIAWNANAMVFTVMPPSFSPASGKMITEYSDEKLKKYGVDIFNLSSSDMIKHNKNFQTSMSGAYDIVVWYNLDKWLTMLEKWSEEMETAFKTDKENDKDFPSLLEKWSEEMETDFKTDKENDEDFPSFDPVKSMPPHIRFAAALNEYFKTKDPAFITRSKELLKDSSMMFYVNFMEGKMEMGARSFVNEEQQKNSKAVIKDYRPVSGLKKYVSFDNVVFLGSMQLNFSELMKQYMELFEGLEDTVKKYEAESFLEAIKTLFDGTALASVSLSPEDARPLITIAFSAKDNKGYEAVIDILVDAGVIKKEGEYYKGPRGVKIFKEDGAFIVTNDLKSYKNAEPVDNNGKLKLVSSVPMAAYIDIKSILNKISASGKEEIPNELINAFKDMRIISISNDGVPDESKLTVNFTDDKTNSLKTFIQISLKMGEIFSRPTHDRARAGAAKGDIGAFNSALNLYQVSVESNRYPLRLNQLLEDGALGWDGPYIVKIRKDPWGGDYNYSSFNDGLDYSIFTTKGRPHNYGYSTTSGSFYTLP